MQPIRHSVPLVFQGATSYRWTVFSPRVGRIARFYSALEYDHYCAIESDPEVEVFCEQPVRFEIALGEKRYASVLDMWVRYRNGHEEYREVKPAAKVTEASLQIQAARRWCETQAIPFRVITETDLGLDPQALANWKKILPYLADTTWTVRHGLDAAIERYLRSRASVTLAELESCFPAAPPTEVHRATFALLYRGTAAADLSGEPLTRRTLFRFRDNG